ncbi:hypothetical protein KVE30_01000 [Helicobacter pylori]|nr:hypothetical protein KVE30_01000 [Helicobacter pylori]
MKNINYIKHFKNIKNISNNKKKRLVFDKKTNQKVLPVLETKRYRDFIVQIKSKQQSDDAILENLELSYLNAGT